MMREKKRDIIKFTLDILMVLAFAVLFNKTLLGGQVFHEIVGLALCAAILFHMLLNRGWIAGVTKRLCSRKLPVRTIIVYVADLMLLICVMVILVTGILVSEIVFVNHFGIHANVKNLHISVSYLALFFLGIHLGLVWSKVVFKLKKLFRLPQKNKALGIAAAIAAALIFTGGTYTMITDGYFREVALLVSAYPEKGNGEGYFHGGSANETENNQQSNGKTVFRQTDTENTATSIRKDLNGTSGNGNGNRGGHGRHRNSSSLFTTLYKNISIMAAFAVLTYYIDKLLCRKKQLPQADADS